MKKQKKQLIILIVVILVLGGCFLGLRQYAAKQESETPEAEGTALTALTKEDVVRFAYDYEDVTYEYDKVDDTWYYTPDHELTLTQYRLNTIAGNLAGLTAEDTIENVEDLSQYGLSEDSRTVTFASEGESYAFWIGDHNELMGLYYICRPSETTVYTVKESVITSLNLNVEDIVEEEEETTTEASEAETLGDGTEEVPETEAQSDGIEEIPETEALEDGTEEVPETEAQSDETEGTPETEASEDGTEEVPEAMNPSNETGEPPETETLEGGTEEIPETEAPESGTEEAASAG